MTKFKTPRWGWALTGSGHFLKESLGLIRELEHVDLFLSKAGAEVLRMYKQELELPRSARVYPRHVGEFVHGRPILLRRLSHADRGAGDLERGRQVRLWNLRRFHHQCLCAGGKVPGAAIVFACDTAPELETEAPKGMVKVYPRPIDLENRERLGAFAGATTVDSIAALSEAIARRRSEIGP